MHSAWESVTFCELVSRYAISAVCIAIKARTIECSLADGGGDFNLSLCFSLRTTLGRPYLGEDEQVRSLTSFLKRRHAIFMSCHDQNMIFPFQCHWVSEKLTRCHISVRDFLLAIFSAAQGNGHKKGVDNTHVLHPHVYKS